MKVTIIGAGYVGLVSGACMAETGASVICVDIDRDKIDRLEQGHIPIHEPGLADMIARNSAKGRLAFSSDVAAAARSSELVFLAVGTPTDPETGRANLDYLHDALDAIIPAAPRNCTIVTKSTVPVGTARRLEAALQRHGRAGELHIASNPEFLSEGRAVTDFMQPDRIVIGCRRQAAERALRQLYAFFIDRGVEFVSCSPESAELIKYASNACLATRIAFVNEMADLCEVSGADIATVTHGMGLDPRIGPHFLKAGPGYGGSCFPKDTRALAAMGRELGRPQTIVESVVAANSHRLLGLADRVTQLAGPDLTGKRIAVLGLTFKAGTDDIRDAASLSLIPRLLEKGARVSTYDPEGMGNARSYLNGVEWADSALDACRDADCMVVLTEWPEFTALETGRLPGLMKRALVVDFRNLFSAPEMKRLGIEYHRVGRSL